MAFLPAAPPKPARSVPRDCMIVAVVALVAAVVAFLALDAWGDEAEPADGEPVEVRATLPTDRLRERQLDRARRLIADSRWSDAATLLDELLAADRDFFFRPQPGQATWRSVKTEAARLIGGLPAAGRSAYELQFRARAERLLREAIADGDAAGIVAVAGRWFHTPAGQRATLLAALDALDAGQPLAAAAWLGRLAAEHNAAFEPTLSVMRAVAWWRAGDRQTAADMLEEARRHGGTVARVGGREVSLAFPPGGAAAWLESIAGAGGAGAERRAAEWWMPRGDAARNARTEAARPLLVPRYRVPLTRHPEEARQLEKRRRSFADRDAPLIPAGTPLAVGGTVLVHSPLGLLAVDFASGKRIWLRGGGSDAAVPDAGDDSPDGRGDGVDGMQRVFDDGTNGAASSDGRLVFVVEPRGGDRDGEPAPGPRRGGTVSGQPGVNGLAAYDLADRGAPVWRLPAAERRPDGPAAWYLGPPLPLGGELFVLAEERGEIRLDVLEAPTGRLLWSQPLAELDEDQQADRPETTARRLAGLSPACAEGVLVCPTGAGTAVAVDLATRTLLWAYHYPVSGGDDEQRAGRGPLAGAIRAGRIVVNGAAVGEQPIRSSGWRDACPVVAAGRVLLTPLESDTLHCVDLRTGFARWTAPRQEGLYVAGVVDGRAVVVGSGGVASLSMEDGTAAWQKPVASAPAAVSGRGILTPRRLLLPLDTPEVVEIDLADGRITGRSPARGGTIPGNLVAYRGEVISQGIDSLDVFHQVAPLEGRIETAANARPDDPWALLWRGQLALDGGRVADGLRAISAARRADPARIPAELVADALLFGMRRDFAAAAPLWREISETAGPLPRSKALLCIAIDNQIAAGAVDEAWRSCRALLELPPAVGADDDWLIGDVADPALVIAEPRWLRGRIGDLLAKASPALHREIDTFVAAALAEARADDAEDPPDALARLSLCFAAHPAAATARRMLLEALDERLASRAIPRDTARTLALERELLRREIAAGAPAPAAAGTTTRGAWPLGRVAVHRGGRARPEEQMRLSRMIPVPVDPRSESDVPGLQIGCDVQSQALVVSDGVGRRLGDPIPCDAGRGGGLHIPFQPVGAEAAALGPLVLVRSGGALAALDVGGGGAAPRRLWLVNDAAGLPPELPPFGIQTVRGGGRLKRNGKLALGIAVSEPDMPAAARRVRGMLPLASGAALLVDQTLEFRDPVDGVPGWRRSRLPAAGELIGDEEFLCVCPRDGRRATVLATGDGRFVRNCTLPPDDRRLAIRGRRILTIATASGPRVTLDWIDPARDERTRIGEFSGDARGAQAGPDLFAVLEPDGTLTLVDLDRGVVRSRTTLPDMPSGLDQLRVMPWEDRLLVVAGRRETAQELKVLERAGPVAALPQMVPGDDAAATPFSGSIWAVSRDDGAPLWPVPATVVRHCLHPHQPAGLPVLVFARHLPSHRDGDRVRLSVLALDKRTGHAVYADDRIGVQPHVFSICQAAGDPDAHSVTLSSAGADAAEIRLQFTGEPMAPRPPHQAAARPAGGGDLLGELESWLQRAITIPLPF